MKEKCENIKKAPCSGIWKKIDDAVSKIDVKAEEIEEKV